MKLQYQISGFIIFRPMTVELLHADKRTERHDEANKTLFEILQNSLKHIDELYNCLIYDIFLV